MGASDKKQTTQQTQNTTSNQHSTASTTQNVPDWIANPAKAMAARIAGFADQGPEAYAPKTSALQSQSFQSAAGLKNSDLLREAGDSYRGVGDVSATNGSAASLLDGGLDRYYNPFKEQITNPVLNDYDVMSGQTRAGQAAQAARNKSFQGSRYGIQEAETEGQLARGRAATEGGLLSDMFKTSTSLANSDADRRNQVAMANAAAANSAAMANQQAGFQRAGGLAGLGATEGSETRANLGIQAGLGGIQTDQENAARQYPLEFQRQQEQLLAGLNPEMYTGRTVDQSGTSTGTENTNGSSTQSDLLGGLGQAAQIAALFASDGRVKRDVRTVGFDQKGRRWVSFAYVWAPLKRLVGVIAQEVMRTDPQAVHVGPSGYMVVNYGALD